MERDSSAADELLHIRDARPEDFDEVSRLIEDAYREYEGFVPPTAWKAYLADITDVRSRAEDSEVIVAELDGRLVGTVTLYPDASRSIAERWPRGWASLRLLAVHPAYRRRGVGRALMDESIRRCRERGARMLGLHTTALMREAKRMYERMGFVRAPKYDFQPDPGAIVMAYRLEL